MAKTGWPVKTLGEIITLAYGRPLDAKDRHENGAIPVYGANGVKARSKRSLVEGPSIIVGRKGSAGELNFCNGPFWPLDVTYYVEHDVKETDLKFLYFLLSLLDLPRLAKGVKPGINRNEVYGLTTQVPPLDEQKRIVALLDDATARITELTACYEQARTHANDLFTSALRDALEGNSDWPVKTLGEVLALAYGKPLEATDRDENGPFPVYGANGVKARSRRSLVAGPSIIVGRKGSAGELNVCKSPFWPLDVTYYVEHDLKETDLLFLYYLLSLMDLPSLAKGVKPGINRNEVYALTAPLPPLDEQKRIVARLDQLRAKASEMVAAYDAKLQAAKNLRQSILEAAFAGEL